MFIRECMTAQHHAREVLHLFLFVQTMANPYFQQDNVLPQWPARTPDLSPIEHCESIFSFIDYFQKYRLERRLDKRQLESRKIVS